MREREDSKGKAHTNARGILEKKSQPPCFSGTSSSILRPLILPPRSRHCKNKFSLCVRDRVFRGTQYIALIWVEKRVQFFYGCVFFLEGGGRDLSEQRDVGSIEGVQWIFHVHVNAKIFVRKKFLHETMGFYRKTKLNSFMSKIQLFIWKKILWLNIKIYLLIIFDITSMYVCEKLHHQKAFFTEKIIPPFVFFFFLKFLFLFCSFFETFFRASRFFNLHFFVRESLTLVHCKDQVGGRNSRKSLIYREKYSRRQVRNGFEPTQIKMTHFQTLPTCYLYSVSFKVKLW